MFVSEMKALKIMKRLIPLSYCNNLSAKGQILLHVLSLSILVCMQGCSSISSHFEGEFGHPYSGVESSISSVSCNIAVSSIALFVPVPFIIADIPLSAVLDTVFLPVDSIASPELERQEIVFTNQKCFEGMGNENKTNS